MYRLHLVAITLSFFFFFNFCFIPNKESQNSHFGYGGLKARASSLVGNDGNLILKCNAKRYLLGVRGRNFIVGILSKNLSLKVRAV